MSEGDFYRTPPRRLREMAVNERPQERLERYGAGALSDTELLAMLLRSGSPGLDVIGLASQLIAEAGSLSGLLTWSAADFRKLKGIGPVKALQLLTTLEVARRVLEQKSEALAFTTPGRVYRYLQPVAAGVEVEKFWVLCLNRKHRLIRRVEVSSGTASSSLVHPREVFREAIRLSASAVICAHNHPSGDPSPSDADIKVTRQLRQAAGLLEIDLLDHVIVGRADADPNSAGFYSFAEAGMLS